MNKLKNALINNKVTFGTWMQIGHPAVAEVLASHFDWICVDLEHGIIDIESMTNLFRAIENGGSVPIVRISSNDPIWIHRVLDAGAKGLVFPMIKTCEDALVAINESKYPPIGKRSFGYSRANLYGKNFDKYVKSINDEIVIILQVEHIDTIDNLDEILSLDSFDGTFIGPYDLSGSMGFPGKFNNIEYLNILEKYLNRSNEYKKPTGLHIVRPNKDNIKESIRKGYKMIALGIDTVFLEEYVKIVESILLIK